MFCFQPAGRTRINARVIVPSTRYSRGASYTACATKWWIITTVSATFQARRDEINLTSDILELTTIITLTNLRGLDVLFKFIYI